jgi:hypothetical protein
VPDQDITYFGRMLCDRFRQQEDAGPNLLDVTRASVVD